MEGKYLSGTWHFRLIIYVAIGIFVIAVLIAGYGSYQLATRSDRQAEIATLTQQVLNLKMRVRSLDRYIEELKETHKLETRWSDFLAIMLDPDQKVRLEVVDEYIKKNRLGLYKAVE